MQTSPPQCLDTADMFCRVVMGDFYCISMRFLSARTWCLQTQGVLYKPQCFIQPNPYKNPNHFNLL